MTTENATEGIHDDDGTHSEEHVPGGRHCPDARPCINHGSIAACPPGKCFRMDEAPEHPGHHGWLLHDGHPPHLHNPVTGKIRWATEDEINRVGGPRRAPEGTSTVFLQGAPRTCPPDIDNPNMIVTCTLNCGTGPCSRSCQVCKRISWTNSPPCPACPDAKAAKAICGSFGCVLPQGHNLGRADIPENHKTDRQVREKRCPDKGYCHGSTLAAGSSPCAPGTCLRVITSSPLSGVFPDDRWPYEVLLANGMASPGKKPFGDGSDGDAVLDGTSEVRWARRDGMTYFMTRDAHLTGLVVERGVTLGGGLAPTPWKLLCRGTIVNRGTIIGSIEHQGDGA